MDTSTINILTGAAIALIASIITSVINHFLEVSRNERARLIDKRKAISKYQIENIDKVVSDVDELSKSSIEIGSFLSEILTTTDPSKLLLQAENINKVIQNGLIVYINLARIDNPEIKTMVFDYRDEVFGFYNYMRNIIFQKYENKEINNEEVTNELEKWTKVVTQKYINAIEVLTKERFKKITDQ
jgi:hypothetical protein